MLMMPSSARRTSALALAPLLLAALALAGAGLAQEGPMFPEPPPIADADPAVRHDRAMFLPAALVLEGPPGRLSAHWSLLERVHLEVGHRMVLGTEIALEARAGGELVTERLSLTGGVEGLCSVVNPVALLPELAALEGEVVIEATVRIFETDVPPQHMWSPQAGRHYRVLHERTIRTTRPR